MDPQLRTRAEDRLTAAAAALDLADPRPPYRERLRALRETQPDAFDEAIAHYEQQVLPALCSDDPLTVWLEYGRLLAGAGGPVRLSFIDESGRMSDATSAISRNTLVLFIPEDTAEAPLVAAQPAVPSRAQQATLDLLIHRKLTL